MNITDEAVEVVARAIAKAADADYWVDEIRGWGAMDEWEQDAHGYPSMAFEDRDEFRKQAHAALTAIRSIT